MRKTHFPLIGNLYLICVIDMGKKPKPKGRSRDPFGSCKEILSWNTSTWPLSRRSMMFLGNGWETKTFGTNMKVSTDNAWRIDIENRSGVCHEMIWSLS